MSNLVISRIGDKSAHATWMGFNGDREFDLWLSYYGTTPGRYEKDADWYEVRPGLKWPAIAAIVDERWSLVREYDCVCFPDCDVEISSTGWTRFFELFKKFDLWIAQPALAKGSNYSHGMLLRDDRFQVRFTSFVEIMAPCFSKKALECCRRTFSDSQSGWGLDWVWKTLVNDTENRKVGVIDAVTMLHRPSVGTEILPALRRQGIDPSREMAELLRKYNVTRTDQVFGGIPTHPDDGEGPGISTIVPP